MHRNVASQRIIEDQVNDVSIEARIARFESDLGHVKKDVAQMAQTLTALQAGLTAANEATMALKIDLVKTANDLRAEFKQGFSELRAEVKQEIDKLRTEVKQDISAVKQDVAALKQEVSAVKQDISAIREDIAGLKANQTQFATKADLATMETRILKWIIASVASTGTLAFSIAKFVS